MKKKVKIIFMTVCLGVALYANFLQLADASYEEIEKEYNDLLVNYYRNAQPDKIPAALEHIAASEFIKTSPTDVSAMTAYLFGRIARQEPSLVAKYMEVFEKATQTHEGRVFILMVFQICGNEEVKHFLEDKLNNKDFVNEKQDMQNILNGGLPIGFDPLKREIKNGVDLDFLWAEYFVTGAKEPIVKIVDTLGWPDRFKLKLQEWRDKKRSSNEKRILDKLLNRGLQMDVDLDKIFIKETVDLDGLFAAQIQFRAPDKKQQDSIKKIRKMLNISDEDIMYMAVKGAAMWSLQSNAQQHPKVLQFCKEEFEKRNDKSKIELAIVLEVAAQGSIELIPEGDDGLAEIKLREK